MIGYACGPGYQPIPVLLVPSLSLTMVWARTTRSSTVRFAVVAWLAISLGSFLAYAGSFVVHESSPWKSKRTKLMVPIAMENAVKILLPFLVERWLSSLSLSLSSSLSSSSLSSSSSFTRSTGRGSLDHGRWTPGCCIARYLGFPVLWTALWNVDYYWWNRKFGDFGNWHASLSLLGWEPLTVGATWTLGAVSGGNFVMALLAVSLVMAWEWCSSGSGRCGRVGGGRGGRDDNDDDDKYDGVTIFKRNDPQQFVPLVIQDQRYREEKRPSRHRDHHWIPAVLLLLFFTVGSMYLSFAPHVESFYQRPIEMFAPKTLQVSCLIKGSLTTTVEHLQGPGRDSKLVVWSESSTYVLNETEFLEQARTISQRFNVTLGLAYSARYRVSNYHTQNKFVLITPNPSNHNHNTAPRNDSSTIALRYQKTHPVPQVEDTVEPGSGDIPVVQTWFGRVGAAMYVRRMRSGEGWVFFHLDSCFDFNFPFVNQVHGKYADLMIQPSWTWGPNGVFHAYVNRLRAVENGFTQIRCSSYGVSGIFDPFHRIHLQQYTLGHGHGFVTEIPLYGRRWTMYGALGGSRVDAFFVLAAAAWITSAAALAALAALPVVGRP